MDVSQGSQAAGGRRTGPHRMLASGGSQAGPAAVQTLNSNPGQVPPGVGMRAEVGCALAGLSLGPVRVPKQSGHQSLPCSQGMLAGSSPRPDPSCQTLYQLHPVLGPILQLFLLAVTPLPLCSCEFGHHLGQRLPWLSRSWFCHATILGFGMHSRPDHILSLFFYLCCCFEHSVAAFQLSPQTPTTTTTTTGPSSFFF